MLMLSSNSLSCTSLSAFALLNQHVCHLLNSHLRWDPIFLLKNDKFCHQCNRKFVSAAVPADPQSLFLHGYAEQHPYGSVDASDPFSELHSCFVAGYLSEVQENLTKQ